MRKVSGRKEEDSNDQLGEDEACSRELSLNNIFEERKSPSILVGKGLDAKRSYSANEGDGVAGLDTLKRRKNIKKI